MNYIKSKFLALLARLIKLTAPKQTGTPIGELVAAFETNLHDMILNIESVPTVEVPQIKSIESIIMNFTLQSLEQHLAQYAKTAESEVVTKLQQFVEWAKNEEGKIAEAVALLKAKGLQVMKDGVTL